MLDSILVINFDNRVTTASSWYPICPCTWPCSCPIACCDAAKGAPIFSLIAVVTSPNIPGVGGGGIVPLGAVVSVIVVPAIDVVEGS